MHDVEIVAACDLSLESARAAAPRAYTSAEEMLNAEDLDFVDIATRSTTHMDLVSLGAERGLAIICQKPPAVFLSRPYDPFQSSPNYSS